MNVFIVEEPDYNSQIYIEMHILGALEFKRNVQPQLRFVRSECILIFEM